MVSIWSTVEVDAWSRDFKYSDYIHLHKAAEIPQEPLTFDAYQAFKELMHVIYEDNLK